MKPIEELTFTDDYMFGYVMRNEEICKGLLERLLKGKKYSELKESFIIFVCKDDFYEEGLPCYTFSNLCHEKRTLEFGDKTHKVIFNASAFSKEKDLERKSLLEYINNKESTSDFTKMIDLLVEKTKENQTFRGDYMAWGLAEQDAEKRGYNAGIADGISQGISQGAEQKAIETAKNFIKMGFSLEQVAQGTGLSLEQVKAI